MVGGPRVAAGVGGGRAWSACIVERAGDAGDAVPSSWPAVCGSTIPPSSARTSHPRSARRAGPWWRTDSGGSMSGGVAPASLPGGVRGGSEGRQLCPARRQGLLTHRLYARAARLLLQLLHGRRRENGAHPVVRTFTEGPLEHGRRVAYVLLSFRTRSRRRHPGEEQQPPLHARPAPADLDGVGLCERRFPAVRTVLRRALTGVDVVRHRRGSIRIPASTAPAMTATAATTVTTRLPSGMPSLPGLRQSREKRRPRRRRLPPVRPDSGPRSAPAVVRRRAVRGTDTRRPGTRSPRFSHRRPAAPRHGTARCTRNSPRGKGSSSCSATSPPAAPRTRPPGVMRCPECGESWTAGIDRQLSAMYCSKWSTPARARRRRW